MKTQSFGFIGGGRITRIFLHAFKNIKASWDDVMVFDTNAEISSKLKQQFPEISIAKTAGEAARADVVFIALHPPVIIEALAGIKDHVNENAIIVSLAPKITIEKMRGILGLPNVMRLIPNATSIINEGYNPFCFAKSFDPTKKIAIISFLEKLGSTFEVDEKKLEGYAIISAMLPTYFWFQWKTLIDLSVDMDMESCESNKAVMQTLEASLKLMFKSGMSYDAVTDLIPVKPIGEHKDEINQILQTKLLGLYQKIKP
ncbi:MAG: NAD(P)-binding domain-containing protein [Bacteroidales bacterium]|nr:NAD(P)-binding domain-containing protein [Bacteroidales bacterium]